MFSSAELAEQMSCAAAASYSEKNVGCVCVCLCVRVCVCEVAPVDVVDGVCLELFGAV